MLFVGDNSLRKRETDPRPHVGQTHDTNPELFKRNLIDYVVRMRCAVVDIFLELPLLEDPRPFTGLNWEDISTDMKL
jgi:hypothetical protein